MWKYKNKTLPEPQEPQWGKRDQDIAGTSHFPYLPTHELTGVCIKVHKEGASPLVLTDNELSISDGSLLKWPHTGTQQIKMQ